MIRDTDNFRNPNYHKATDTIETIDFSHFTKAAKSLIAIVQYCALDGKL